MDIASITQTLTAWFAAAAQTVGGWFGLASQTAGQVAGQVAHQAAAAASAATGAATAAANSPLVASAASAATTAASSAVSHPMVQAMDLTQLAAMAAALGWASGLRLYAVVFITGAAGYLGWIPLPSGLSVLQNPIVMVASAAMMAVEFFADKIPGIDSVWDTLHTFIRIPAGAALAAGVFGGDSAAWGLVAALAGGTLAATSHAAKTTTRAAANTSPEPFSNIALSLIGDAVVPATLWLAWNQPEVFFPVLAVFVVLAIITIVLLFKFLRAVWRRIKGEPGTGTAVANPA